MGRRVLPVGWAKSIGPKLVKRPHGALVSVYALGLLSIAVLWTAILYDEHADREAALQQAGAQTLSLAVALREHVHSAISGADEILQRLDESYLESRGGFVLPDWARQPSLLDGAFVQVGMISADGRVLASSTDPGAVGTNVSDREPFRVQLNPAAPQPYISPPIIGRVTGKPAIPITRRIERPDGSLAGVGIVALDPAYLTRFLQSIDLGPNGMISLVGRDGVLRARATRAASDVAVGRNFSSASLMKTLLSAPEGTYRVRSKIDGIDRICSFSADSDYPVIVATGMAIDDILAAHRSAAIVQFAAGAVLSLVILWLVHRAMQEHSQRVEREKHLRQSQKLEAIGQLTAGVAHDFNNILTAIKGNIERAYDANRDSDRRTLLGNVEQAAQKGERIVRNLLAYSRKQPLRPEATDVNEIVQNVVNLLRAGLGTRWTIRCELAPHLAHVMAEDVQIETALLNLAINARDAMPAGGTVIFETRPIEAGGTGLPHDLAAGPYVAIRVKDTGAGMPADVAAKAFDPFFTTKEQGTGLGLSQVYGLAKQLGGTVTIDTAQNDGTTVTIYLPVTQVAPPPMQAAACVIERPQGASEATNSTAPVILVADDDSQVREFICSTLSDADYDLVEAYDGPSALDALERYPVRFAVLDIAMPGMSGIDVYERARENGWRGTVLFLSGFTDPASLTRIRGKPFLAKPFRAQALKDRVARILAGADNPSLASQA